MIFGIRGGETVGFKNFTVDDAPFLGGLLGVFIAEGIPLFLVLWFGYRLIKKTKVVKLEEVEFDFDKAHNNILFALTIQDETLFR